MVIVYKSYKTSMKYRKIKMAGWKVIGNRLQESVVCDMIQLCESQKRFVLY